MPAPVLPQAKVKKLVEAGLENVEIVRKLETEDHVKVTSAAISMFRERHGLPKTRGRYGALLPWTVDRKHAHLYQAKMLRLEGRIRDGQPCSEAEAKRHEAWRQRLSNEGLVVHYDPATAEGFFLVPRRPGVDTDLIRDPQK